MSQAAVRDVAGPARLTAVTALDLFQQDGVDLDQRLRDGQTLGEPADGRHHHLWAAAYGRLDKLASGFLVTDLASIFLFGIGKTQELIDAAEHTRETSEAETVELDGKHLVIEQHPSVDLVMGGEMQRTIPFTLTTEVSVVALAASVSHARIVELTTGTTDLHVTFCAGEARLAEVRRRIDPHVAIDLGAGWELLPT
jgi:hypothetical protein